MTSNPPGERNQAACPFMISPPLVQAAGEYCGASCTSSERGKVPLPPSSLSKAHVCAKIKVGGVLFVGGFAKLGSVAFQRRQV